MNQKIPFLLFVVIKKPLLTIINDDLHSNFRRQSTLNQLYGCILLINYFIKKNPLNNLNN